MNVDEASAPASETASVAIRARPPSPKRLSRKVLLAASLGFAAIVAFALASGLSERPERAAADGGEARVAAASGPPETIRLAPPQYGADDLGGAEASGEAAFVGDSAALLAPADPIWTGAAAAPAHASPPAPDPEAGAYAAPILFEQAEPAGASVTAPAPPSGPRRAFLGTQPGRAEGVSALLTPPRSDHEILAGSVIPAALLTELNSDLPGMVIAQVTAPVFDSVSGAHLLIPQGARLIGAYDDAAEYGDRRLLLVWNRLILPDGASLDLDGMEASDPSGAAGLSDRVDNHTDRLAAGVAISAIIGVTANEAEDDEGQHLARDIGDAAAQEAARSGGRIVERELSVRPTLRVRAGAPVRVLVTRDIRLRPYRR